LSCLHESLGSSWLTEQSDSNTETKPTDLVTRLVARFADNNPCLTEKSAAKMIETYGPEAVERQLAWLDQREVEDNPLKTLRASLKYDWAGPEESADDQSTDFADCTDGEFNQSTDYADGEFNQSTDFADYADGNRKSAIENLKSEKWREVQTQLEMQMTDTAYNTYIRDTELIAIENDTVRSADLSQHEPTEVGTTNGATNDVTWVIGCQTERQQDWLQHRLYHQIARVIGEEVNIKFTVIEKTP
jgi:hypothetical protein